MKQRMSDFFDTLFPTFDDADCFEVDGVHIRKPPEKFKHPEKRKEEVLKEIWSDVRHFRFITIAMQLKIFLWDNSKADKEKLTMLTAQQHRGIHTNPILIELLRNATEDCLHDLNDLKRERTAQHNEFRTQPQRRGEITQYLEDDYQDKKAQMIRHCTRLNDRRVRDVQSLVMTNRYERALSDTVLEWARSKTEKHLFGRSFIQMFSLFLACLTVFLTVSQSLSIEISDIASPDNEGLRENLRFGFDIAISFVSTVNFILITTQSALLALNNREAAENTRAYNDGEILTRQKRDDLFDAVSRKEPFEFDLLECSDPTSGCEMRRQ